jgi:DNA-binding XRE family transcriptional regulator
MRSFRKHLNEKLQDKRFKQLYEEERLLAELSVSILDTREHLGLSQQEVAKRAKISQQQLSRVENGVNCTMTTFLKVCKALGLKVGLKGQRMPRTVGQN